MSQLQQFLRGASKITYNNSSSGLTATVVQAAIDELDLSLDGAISDISDIRTLTGTVDGATNLGTFTGTTIADNSSVKSALQALETSTEGKVDKALYDANTILKADSDDTPVALTVGASTIVGRAAAGSIAALSPAQVRTIINVEDGATADQIASEVPYTNTTSGLAATNVQTAIDEVEGRLDTNETKANDLVTLSGVAANSTSLGTFTGATIPDSSTVKAALQSLETAHEEVDANVNDLVTLSGVAENATHLGTFTGTTIADSSTVKSALQALETYGETTRSLVSNFEWQGSVIDKDIVTPPGSPSTGDRYLIGLDEAGSAGTGAWSGKDGQIAEWNGSAWVFTDVTLGTYVGIDDESDGLYLKSSATVWTKKYFEATTASTGLEKVGFDIRLHSSSAGNGLGFSAGVLSVNVDDSSIEINADSLRVKADGIKDTMIDFGTGAGQVSASDIPVLDSGNNYTATDVEGVLTEIDGRLDVLEGAGSTAWAIKTAAYTAVEGDKLLVNTSGGAVTITLPASAVAGDEVVIRDAKRTSETNAITVARNGLNIGGLAEDMTMNINGVQVHLVYVDAGHGWSVSAA
jgi:hypothetical protein